jgi:CRISPR/Cas system Type II protein with McrA/HNH and RuvC-like nuclease domain
LCGNEIEDEQILSVDHLIPFSFLFSDDLWNLAFSHKGCNSQKLDKPPSKKAVDAQNKRNYRLYRLVSEQYPEMAKEKLFKPA